MSHGCNKEMPGKLIMIRKKIQENINTINLKSRKWVKIQKKKVRRYKSKKVTEGTDKKNNCTHSISGGDSAPKQEPQ